MSAPCRVLSSRACPEQACGEQPCAMFAERAPVLPPVLTSLEQAERSAPDDPRDAGALALARRYAELLDQTEVSAQYRKPIERIEQALQEHVLQLENIDAERLLTAWSKVRSALAEHTTASDLGPKLLAALTALGLTPAGRSKTGPGALPDNVSTMPKTPLQLLRDKSANRYGRTAG